MKRIIFVLVVAILAAASPCQSFDAALSTTNLTSSGQACSGRCYLSGMTVYTDGTNDATIIVYNGTSASGAEVTRYKVFGALYSDRVTWPYPIACQAGIYVAVSGTGAGAIVEYMKK